MDEMAIHANDGRRQMMTGSVLVWQYGQPYLYTYMYLRSGYPPSLVISLQELRTTLKDNLEPPFQPLSLTW